MAHPQPQPRSHGRGGARSSHFHMPAQLLMGFIGIAAGSLLLLKKFGMDYIPFLPESLLIYACAAISIFGGIHMVISKIFKPRLYL